MLTSHDIVISIQSPINCNLSVFIFESRDDIKNQKASPGGGGDVLLPTRVDFSLPKIQNKPRILKFFLEQVLVFDVLLQNRIIFNDLVKMSKCQLLPESDRFNPNFLFEKYACLLAKETVYLWQLLSVNRTAIKLCCLWGSYFLPPDVNLGILVKKIIINKRIECFNFCSIKDVRDSSAIMVCEVKFGAKILPVYSSLNIKVK